MKLLDLQEKRVVASSLYMAFFMEGAIPTQAQLDAPDIQKIINDCLVAVPYMNGQYSTGGKMIMQPLNRAEQQRLWALHSAWQEVDTIYGKQVLPKTKINRYRDLNDATNLNFSNTPSQQIINMFAMDQMPRLVGSAASINVLATAQGGYWAQLDPADPTKAIVAEYDFGADVEITGVMKISGQTNEATNSMFNSVLQAQINGVWTDVTALMGVQPSSSDATMTPILNGKVTARYFRTRITRAQQWLYPSGLRFFGKYVNGTPRTFGKIGHVILMPFNLAQATFDSNVFGLSASCNIMLASEKTLMDDRNVALSAYTVTDNPKQISSNDLFIPTGLTFEQGSNLYPPFFTTLLPVTELGAL
ncbi:hypothetical protein JA13_076 [Dickeya phage vB_DsoM_JA13]|uniref:Uncharacterized protein n=1 Tax=Dickeya phage vB_DsoM_JA13 TaxID=2283030 RepID=A0A384ZW64_9CAUD|nr:hypothetical protein JA13_076 [Dickeya phage vB_DsoM_JA13]